MTHGLLTLAVLLLLAALSMAVFTATGRRDADADRKGSHFVGGSLDFLVHWLMWVLGPAERLSLRLGLSPDVFNAAGLLLGAVSGVCIGMGALEAGGWAIALGGVADILDGRIARARGMASDYGGFIDSTLDRFVETFALLGFAVYLRQFEFGPAVATAALGGSLLVSYARARGEALGVSCKEGLMQRAERLVLLFLVCLADPALAAHGVRQGLASVCVLSLIAGGTFLTAVHRTVWIATRLRERDRARSGSKPAEP